MFPFPQSVCGLCCWPPGSFLHKQQGLNSLSPHPLPLSSTRLSDFKFTPASNHKALKTRNWNLNWKQFFTMWITCLSPLPCSLVLIYFATLAYMLCHWFLITVHFIQFVVVIRWCSFQWLTKFWMWCGRNNVCLWWFARCFIF